VSYKRAVITVTHSLSSTSMEFNEFVLFRARHFPEELHFLVSYAPIVENQLRCCDPELLKNIRILDCQRSPFVMRQRLKTVIHDIQLLNIPSVFHFGHLRPALLTHLFCSISRQRPPSLFTIHSSFKNYRLPSKILSLANFFLSDHVNYVGQAACDSYPHWLRHVRNSSVHVITNGVDLDRVDIICNLYGRGNQAKLACGGKATQEFKLINVGRLVGAKNQKWLIKLMTELPDEITLTIVGSGNLEKDLIKLSCDLQIDHRVKLTGSLEREDVYREILNSDLFVSSSIREGLPIAVLEAMALVRPTILSDIPPHKEIGQYGESVGILALDKALWRERIDNFRKNQAKLRQIGQENRKIVESHFSLASMHNQYTKLYRLMWSKFKSAGRNYTQR